MSSSPAPAPVTHEATVSAKLIVLEPVPAKPKAKKAATTKKVTRIKQFNFTFKSCNDNYIQLLNKILTSHYINDYEATSQKTFTCKVQVPPEKVSDARDIENYEEYQVIAEKIVAEKPGPTKLINITVDLTNVQKHAKKKASRSASPDSSDNEEAQVGMHDQMNENGLSKVDVELARFRGLLEKKYQNDHDGGYTYIDSRPGGETLPLTMFMMGEWARAMYDGTATVSRYPSTPTFDPVNRHESLSRQRSHSSATTHSSHSGGPSDIAHMASLVKDIFALTRPASNPAPSTPHNKASNSLSDPQTPPRNTPTKLTRFLEYAQDYLGVPHAITYEQTFKEKGYGPDILHLVDNTALCGIGLAEGDVIRLKQNALTWWNSAGKRKRLDTDVGTSTRPPPVPVTPPNIKIRFDRRYHNGGNARIYGPRITPGKPPPDQDFDMLYFCEARRCFVPVPDGYVAIVEEPVVIVIIVFESYKLSISYNVTRSTEKTPCLLCRNLLTCPIHH
ncbi:hypothetical protein FPV67DRAFT_1425555 [Lyophyllum atratum]|nr:hypothetical protein FPV67DRAFT_1425555 [Lyophyllum atratum]